jgi:hypothetical protein
MQHRLTLCLNSFINSSDYFWFVEIDHQLTLSWNVPIKSSHNHYRFSRFLISLATYCFILGSLKHLINESALRILTNSSLDDSVYKSTISENINPNLKIILSSRSTVCLIELVVTTPQEDGSLSVGARPEGHTRSLYIWIFMLPLTNQPNIRSVVHYHGVMVVLVGFF